MENVSIFVDNGKSLFDITKIDLSAETPQERFQQYLEQTGNPYQFRVDDVTVKLEFKNDAKSFMDSLASAINCG